MCLTQEQLADKIHVSKSAVAKWETDRGIPDRDNLYSLAKILNVNVNDFHHIIESRNYEEVDIKVNITTDVIATLESYGYTIIRPGEKRKEKSDG